VGRVKAGRFGISLIDDDSVAGNRYEFSTPIEANPDELVKIASTRRSLITRCATNRPRKDVAFDPKILDGKCTEGSRCNQLGKPRSRPTGPIPSAV
jgi:hypothetical protein